MLLAWIALALLQWVCSDRFHSSVGLLSPTMVAAEPAVTEPASDGTSTTSDTDTPSASGETETDEGVSSAMAEADMVMQLEASLEADQEKLESLQQDYDSPESEYRQAESAMQKAVAEVTELGKQAEDLKAEGKPIPDELVSALKTAQEKETLAKKRFEVAFEERKALREKITTLDEILAQSKEALAKLTGEPDPESTATNAPVLAVPPVGASAPVETPTAPTPEADQTAQTPNPSEESTNQVETARSKEGFVETRKLLEAREELSNQEAEARRAEDDLSLFRTRYLTRKRELETMQKLIESAQKKADLANQERSLLEEQLAQKTSNGATATELAEIQSQLQDATDRLSNAAEQKEEHQKRVEELQTILSQLEELEAAAVRAADARQEAVQDAQKAVHFLENPFHPQNLLRWLRTHGPNLMGIVLLMVVATLLIRLLNSRIVKLVARTGYHGSRVDRENRAQTLVSVFRSTASLAVIAGGTLMFLDECGVPVGPLLGGAAIIGLALAFGAQRLVGDFFHGFVILLENQYKVNDVIRVAGIAGLVERVTLRVTVLRDLEGCLHFVPNGEIKAVTNMTHGWSRALFDIAVALQEDADQVMETLMQLARELREDPQYQSLILDGPEMLGVDAITDSSMVIKFFIKTQPLQQWTVKREMLRRIKRRFSELGIEIPSPRRLVQLRREEGSFDTQQPPSP